MEECRLDGLQWQRSSWCNGGSCLESARHGDTILVRKSDDPAVTLALGVTEWQEFLEGLRAATTPG